MIQVALKILEDKNISCFSLWYEQGNLYKKELTWA